MSGRIYADPLTLLSRGVTKLNTLWLRATYPFGAFGHGVSVHYSCDISRQTAADICIDDDVYLARDVWLNIVSTQNADTPKIILKKGCKIGRRSTISSRNHVELG